MDLNQDAWAKLKANGHALGRPYIQGGQGLMAVVDEVAIPMRLAKAVADKRLTFAAVVAILRGKLIR